MSPISSRLLLAIGLGLFCPYLAAAPGRSSAAVAAFKRQQPCPATRAPHGACPGWQVDHITPLKCGGPDTPGNMQWLTVADHKVKTKAEAKLCRNREKHDA